MRDRPFRRFQLDRAKARARRHLRLIAYRPEWVTPQAVGRHAADRVKCSCPMCGNARRHRGEVTRQELRADPADREHPMPAADPEPRSGGSR